jgi:hypothetical protein
MTAHPPSKLSKLLYAAVTLAVFGLVGPPVGGIAAWALMGARAAQSPYPFLSDSYAEGLVLALGTGLLVLAVALTVRSTSWVVAVAAAVVANAVFFAASISPWRQPAAPVRCSPSLLAALVCWALTRSLLQRLQS